MGWQIKGRGRIRQRSGEMNKTEAAYAQVLEYMRMEGEIAWYVFESVKFRLADRTWYCPDFMVMKRNGDIELHEVKGFMEDDANVKVKSVAENFPFPIVIIKQLPKKDGGGWDERIV